MIFVRLCSTFKIAGKSTTCLQYSYILFQLYTLYITLVSQHTLCVCQQIPVVTDNGPKSRQNETSTNRGPETVNSQKFYNALYPKHVMEIRSDVNSFL